MIHMIFKWSVVRDQVREHDRALRELSAHLKAEHPGIHGARCWEVSIGSDAARPGRIWVETYESWADYDKVHTTEATPGCGQAWAPVYGSIVPGTLTTSMWKDAVTDAWFDRD